MSALGHDTGVTTLSMGVPASSASAPPSASDGISGSSMHRATPPSPACDFGGDSRQPAAAASPMAVNNKRGLCNFIFDMGSPRLLLKRGTRSHKLLPSRDTIDRTTALLSAIVR